MRSGASLVTREPCGAGEDVEACWLKGVSGKCSVLAGAFRDVCLPADAALVPSSPCPAPADPWALVPPELAGLCSAPWSSAAVASQGAAALAFWPGPLTLGLGFYVCEEEEGLWDHIAGVTGVSITDRVGVSPQCAGSPRRWGESTVAGTCWPASGHGRPACGTSARTSAELSSLTPSGWFPLPTAFSSESFLGARRQAGRAGDCKGKRSKGVMGV